MPKIDIINSHFVATYSLENWKIRKYLQEQKRVVITKKVFGSVHSVFNDILKDGIAHQLDIFKKYPERLAPVISGYDPVIFTDQRKLVDGIRELGVSYKGQVYLFNSKHSLQQFWTAPDRYANHAGAAMQRTR